MKHRTVIENPHTTLSLVMLSLQVSIFLVYSFMLWVMITYQPRITCLCKLMRTPIRHPHLPPLFVVEWMLFAGSVVSTLAIAAALREIRKPGRTSILAPAFAGVAVSFVLILLYYPYIFDYMWLLAQLNMFVFVMMAFMFVSIVTASIVGLDWLLRRVEGRFASGSAGGSRRKITPSIGVFNSIAVIASVSLLIAAYILYLMWGFINPAVWSMTGNTFTQMQPWLAFVLLILIILISCATMFSTVWLNRSRSMIHDSA